LLDTHALLWLDRDDPCLGSTADRMAERALADGALAASAITFWEIALLLSKARLELAKPIGQWRRDLLTSGLVECPVNGEIGVAAAQLGDLHGDAAERLLAWTGLLERHDARL
jgi:PIN domain nuclease of toxin-antitoxin system